MQKFFLFPLLIILLFTSCTDTRATNSSIAEFPHLVSDTVKPFKSFIDTSGMTVKERFPLPDGFYRTSQGNLFAEYLRQLPLYPVEHDVRYFDGSKKPREGVYCSVVNLPIGTRDRHQCADAVMNVRAHYLYNAGMYDKIHFNFTNGFRADYSKWREGKRINISGNHVSYYQTSKESTSYESFLDYLQKVYCYAGTYSLSKELKQTKIHQIEPGNVFIKGGFPGHAVIVVDVIENASGERRFLLAQSYMPAQELQILINPTSLDGSPWYSLNDVSDQLFTPEWTFTVDQLKRFQDE